MTMLHKTEMYVRFERYGIPYEDIDAEMLELVDTLNFINGLKTQFCCYGHEPLENPYVIFDESVDEEMIIHLLAATTGTLRFKKWVRKTKTMGIMKNWILYMDLNYEDPDHPAKNNRFDKVVQEIKAIGRVANTFEGNIERDRVKAIRQGTVTSKPTDGQWRAISVIEDNLGIEFQGATKDEATAFISKHMEKSKEVAYQNEILAEAMLESQEIKEEQ